MVIKIHFYLVIFCVYLYGIQKIKMFLYFYFFTIVHELFHIIVAIILKVKINEIVLLPAGVCAKYDNTYISKIKELLIACSGPIASIIIAFILRDTIYFYINILIGILNLIPLYPMDGGRIFKCVMEMIFGYKRSIVICGYFFKFIGVILITLNLILILYFKNYLSVIFLIYLIFMIIQNIREEKIKKNINEMLNLSL